MAARLRGRAGDVSRRSRYGVGSPDGRPLGPGGSVRPGLVGRCVGVKVGLEVAVGIGEAVELVLGAGLVFFGTGADVTGGAGGGGSALSPTPARGGKSLTVCP